MSTAGALGAGGGGGRVGCGAVLAFCDEASELKSRSMAVSSLPAGLAAAAAGPAAAPEDTSRMNPSLSSWMISRWNSASYSLPLRSEEHTSELQSRLHLVCRLLLEK